MTRRSGCASFGLPVNVPAAVRPDESLEEYRGHIEGVAIYGHQVHRDREEQINDVHGVFPLIARQRSGVFV